MITLIIDYQPFSNSHIFATIDGKEEIYSSSAPSSPIDLVKNIFNQACQLKTLYKAQANEIKVCVRAAEIFYDELSRIALTQLEQTYGNLPIIKMERIE